MNVSTVKLPLLLKLLQGVDFPRKLGVCARLFGNRLSTHGICWVDTAAGIPWKLDLRNRTHRWIVYGKYEGAAFLNWARAHLPSNGIVVDSGANIGQTLLYFGQWVPAGRVFAFEPGTRSADWLEECLKANPQLPVELLRLALGAEPRSAFLREVGEADWHGGWNQISETAGEPVTIVRLDDVLAERGVDRVDLWKLDVEGTEVQALEGAADLLSRQRVAALSVELHGDNASPIQRLLDGFGYELWLFHASGKPFKPSKLPEHDNGLFLPRP